MRHYHAAFNKNCLAFSTYNCMHLAVRRNMNLVAGFYFENVAWLYKKEAVTLEATVSFLFIEIC